MDHDTKLRFLGSLEGECLNGMIFLGESHYIDYYHSERIAKGYGR